MNEAGIAAARRSIDAAVRARGSQHAERRHADELLCVDVDLRPRLCDHAGRGRRVDRGEVAGFEIGQGRLLWFSPDYHPGVFTSSPRWRVFAPSLRAKRSNPSFGKESMDCFVAGAPRNDVA